MRSPGSSVARLAPAGLAAIVLLAVVAATRLSHREARISKAEAIRLAERFVAENGYTDLDLDPDRVGLTLESIEFASSTKDRLQFRRETLEPKAAGAYPMGDGWEVQFSYKRGKDPAPDARRGVWVRPGKRITIFHQDVY